jgi:hypothetical protein
MGDAQPREPKKFLRRAKFTLRNLCFSSFGTRLNFRAFSARTSGLTLSSTRRTFMVITEFAQANRNPESPA